MAQGTVKWFNSEKGIRLHRARRRQQGRLRSLLRGQRRRYKSLEDDQRVEFDTHAGSERPQAENVRPV